MGIAICTVCHYPYEDGDGPGYVARHNKSREHVKAIQSNQATVKSNFPIWEAIEITEELEEKEERLQLRRALEEMQSEQ
jgi:hypothetical protein